MEMIKRAKLVLLAASLLLLLLVTDNYAAAAAPELVAAEAESGVLSDLATMPSSSSLAPPSLPASPPAPGREEEPNPAEPQLSRVSAAAAVAPENVQQPQVVTTSSTNEVPSQPLEEESASTAPADGLEGRKRRRLGRKRKRRPLHDDYWQGNPRDEESELHYHDPQQQQQQQQEIPERKRPYQRWEGSGGFRPRPDRWSNPYSDAIDPSDSPLQRRPYESAANTRGRENFQPILDGNRQRRLPPKPVVEESTASTPGTGYKAYRKPYSQAKRVEEEGGSSGETTGKGTAADLKALLKQSGGLSLSEILQQRNISLQDLIKGKQMALAALTQSPLDLTTITEPENEVTSVIPTLSSVRFRVHDDTTKRPDFQEVKNIKRIPVYSPSAAPMIGTENPTTSTTTTTTTTQLPPSAQDETNSVEDIITLENLGNRNDNVAIFPTVEIKQLALNPVLPTVKEERLRPIKGVASRIRPDLSNSNIRTEETIKRRPEFPVRSYATAEQWHSSTTTTPSTTTTREKWTPSPGLNEKREQFLQKLNQSKMRGRPSTTATTEPDNLDENTESLALSDTEQPIQASSERSLMRVPTPRVRIAIKPKQRQPPPSVTTAETEIHEEPENVTKLLETEPELNIIEKFTSFADVKSSGEPQYAVHEPTNEEEDQQRLDSLDEDDLIERINQNTQRSFTDSLEDYIRDVTESNPSLFNDLTPIGLSEDRRDILELMEDRRIGARLAKVLSQRNMSLEELLEHRKRGSSQLHLSEMITNKVKPMEDKMDIVTAFEHFPRFNIGNLRSIRPDDIKQDSQGFSYFTSIINIRPTDETHKEGRSMQDKHKVLDWKLPHGTHQKLDHFLGNGGPKGGLITPSRMSADAEFDSGNDQSASSDLLDLELTGHGFNHRHTVTIESTTMPLGVKSAILASSCIVGVSLAIFAVIFIVCRWRQRRRNKLNYTENFNMAKGRLPIHHQEGMKTALNDHHQMVYTTGQHQLQRKDSKVNTMDPNSAEVHDYLWDTMRKPFQ